MDIAADARILTLASTNQASTLDRAAVRAVRFDAILEIGCPDIATAAMILAALVDGIPGGDSVELEETDGQRYRITGSRASRIPNSERRGSPSQSPRVRQANAPAWTAVRSRSVGGIPRTNSAR